MPEHTSFLSYLVANSALEHNLANVRSIVGGHPATHSAEPVAASIAVAMIVILLALLGRAGLSKGGDVTPSTAFSATTILEVVVSVFYDMMAGLMGPVRAKKYFPLIGTAALFILVSNVVGLIPGVNPPTSSLNVTLACALIVFVAFNVFGIMENGFAYVAHLAGPVWWLAPLMFPIEVVSLCIRPITLAVRLMLNMAVDHILLGIIAGLVGLFVPIPIMMLGTLVCFVQVYVFCMLSSIYIALATEDMHHGHGDDHAHGAAH
jgi:F-type H+-transporting ATPase subunit a